MSAPAPLEFIKLKNFRTLEGHKTHGVKTTATMVVSRPGRWPWSKRVNCEYDVWSTIPDDTRYLRWRSSGKFIPENLSMACQMAQLFGEIEYAT